MKVGIDVVEEKRFNNKTARFFERFFLESELEYAKSRPCFEQTVAGIFACKEAFLKAVGVGVFRGILLSEVEVCHEKNLKPFLKIDKKIMKKYNINNIDVSISHDGGIATAVCVIFD